MSRTATGPATFKRVVEFAREEAALRGDRRIGTEHLLLALLHDGAAPPARALGVRLEDGRAALAALDRAALAAVGVTFDAPLSPSAPRRRLHLPPNSAARSAITAAKARADAERRGRRIEPRHLLRALLGTRPPDPAAVLLAELGVSSSEVGDRLSAADG